MKNTKVWKKSIVILSCLFLILFSFPAAAAGRGWVAKSDGRISYYNANGKKYAGGVKSIRGREYYFDKKGCQRYGWMKCGSRYSYFRPAKGKYGYRVKNTVKNGIVIDGKGYAKVTAQNKQRLLLLTKANSVAFSLVNWNMTKDECLRRCYRYVRDELDYRVSEGFDERAGWSIRYAKRYFYQKNGDCYTSASGFAYLAAALGYQNVYVCSHGMHGWTEIGGYIYDPGFANVFDPSGFMFYRVAYGQSFEHLSGDIFEDEQFLILPEYKKYVERVDA